MALRAQVSLIFQDEELYNGLVVPYKAERELVPLIVRLLSVYYYNEDIRNAIDGVDSQVIQSINEQEQNAFNETVRKARETLASMNLIADDMSMTLTDGIDEMYDRMNTAVQQTKGVSSQETSFGATVPEIGTGVVVEEEKAVEEPQQPTKDVENKLNTLDKEMASVNAVLGQHKEALDSIMSMLKEIRGIQSETLRESAVNEGVSVEAQPLVQPVQAVKNKEQEPTQEMLEQAQEVQEPARTMLDKAQEVQGQVQEVEPEQDEELDLFKETDTDEEDGTSSLLAFLDDGVAFSTDI